MRLLARGVHSCYILWGSVPLPMCRSSYLDVQYRTLLTKLDVFMATTKLVQTCVKWRTTLLLSKINPNSSKFDPKTLLLIQSVNESKHKDKDESIEKRLLGCWRSY